MIKKDEFVIGKLCNDAFEPLTKDGNGNERRIVSPKKFHDKTSSFPKRDAP